ncbi:hypothetical protein Hypma_000639 [Hypsizygus marmoreus]|uniref:Uncharacterized protein n=1 Tax=Hypsizygus marmoreus TaxID=39966 RepID=A0A369J7S6_HYPMA|nr:hypothetical protein Hypma_000639 [Hypsizygus marmoreus]
MSSEPRSSPPPPGSEQEKALSTAIQKIIGSAFRSSVKGKRKYDKENMLPEELSLHDYGRRYARMGEIFEHISTVADTGIKYDTADSDADDEVSEMDRQLTDGWNLLCNMIPRFRMDMMTVQPDRRAFKKVLSLVEDGILRTRSDDTAGLKFRILAYLNLDHTLPVEPAIIHASTKSDRGWAHPVTARLLCPLEYPATRATYDMIEAGAIIITAKNYPRFLYPDDRVYDPKDVETGLLMGHVMLRVAKHILQGPSASLERPGFHRGKRGNASIMGVTSVTPRIIAYLAVQARFAMTQASSWSVIDAHFDYNLFYWQIVGLFDDGEGADIIAHYNLQVFGSGSPVPQTPDAPPSPPSDLEILKAQRAAKRARLAVE